MTMTMRDRELLSIIDGARLQPDVKPHHQRLLDAVRSIVDQGQIYYVLTHTPDQGEDIYCILVDDGPVVCFELDRFDPGAPPADIEIRTLKEHEKGAGKLGRAKLRLILERVRKELGR